jgi:hypothetical protein
MLLYVVLLFCLNTTPVAAQMRKFEKVNKHIVSFNLNTIAVFPVYSLHYERIAFKKKSWQFGYQIGLGFGRKTEANFIINAGSIGTYRYNIYAVPMAAILSWGKRANKLDFIAEYVFLYANPPQFQGALFQKPYDLYTNTLLAGLGWRIQPTGGGFFLQLNLKLAIISVESVNPGFNQGKAGWIMGDFIDRKETQIKSHAQLGIGWVFPYTKKNKSPQE